MKGREVIAAFDVHYLVMQFLLSELDWDFERFLSRGKTRFRNHFTGYRSLNRNC